MVDYVPEGSTYFCLFLLAPEYIHATDTTPQNKGWTPSNTLVDVIEALNALLRGKPQPRPSKKGLDEAKKLWFE